MTNTQTVAVQELKAERVQGEVMAVAEEPFRLSLKAERVQEPEALAAEPAGPRASLELDLQLSQKQPVMIELIDVGTILTI